MKTDKTETEGRPICTGLQIFLIVLVVIALFEPVSFLGLCVLAYALIQSDEKIRLAVSTKLHSELYRKHK